MPKTSQHLARDLHVLAKFKARLLGDLTAETRARVEICVRVYERLYRPGQEPNGQG